MDKEDAGKLQTRCADVHYHEQPVWRSLLNCAIAFPGQQPLQSVYSWNADMARHLVHLLGTKDVQKRFDVVHIEHLRGSRYGMFLKSKLPDLPLIWDSVDSISHLFRQASSHSRSLFGRLITRFELSRTERAEGNLICLFDHVLITSVTDKGALLELTPGGKRSAPISVLPNGVDLDYFQPDLSVQREPETLVFSGKMSYHANVSMVKHLVAEVMPRIWERRPMVRLIVVGKDPPADVREFAKNSLITITGTVDDIRPYLWKATAAVVPLIYGAGIQNKILEAMATGTPVLTTSKALSSLSAIAGNDILVADTPEDFSLKALQLMDDTDLQRAIGNAGLQYVRKEHNWSIIVSDLLDMYRQAIVVKKQQVDQAKLID
jgi:glycosyltransferase involved in cell wall biosynthesis